MDTASPDEPRAAPTIASGGWMKPADLLVPDAGTDLVCVEVGIGTCKGAILFSESGEPGDLEASAEEDFRARGPRMAAAMAGSVVAAIRGALSDDRLMRSLNPSNDGDLMADLRLLASAVMVFPGARDTVVQAAGRRRLAVVRNGENPEEEWPPIRLAPLQGGNA